MDDDWDFCDRPTSGPTYTQYPTKIPSRTEISRFVSIKGDACGLTKCNSSRPKVALGDGSRWLPLNIRLRTDEEGEVEAIKKRIRNVGVKHAECMPSSMRLALKNRLFMESIRNIQVRTGSKDQLPYFFYGAGVFPNLLGKVLGEPATKTLVSRMTRAYIQHAKRLAVRDKPYPALVRTDDEYDVVPGMLVFGISGNQRAQIQQFEGNQFELVAGDVTFELADGRIADTRAGVYVWNSDLSALVPEEERVWTMEEISESAWYRNVTRNDEDDGPGELEED